MAKKVMKQIKLIIDAGKATPAPPLGPVLGQAGINIGEFTTKFNEETRERMGELVPVVLTIYEDRSFDMEYKVAPASDLIKKAANIKSGSGSNLTKKVGTLSKAQVKEIAEKKLPDLNANDVEQAMKIIEGTARSMGVEVTGK
jgi:large subunit ribosomal protein L11